MATTICPPNQWTTLADLGADTLIESSNSLWVSTEAAAPTDITGAISLPGLQGMVVSSGLPIHIWPGSSKPVKVRSNPL